MPKFPEDYRPNHLCMPSNVEMIFQARFFYPNMCHVCHCLETETMKLKRCSNCNMISYCSREHQLSHWYLHKEFCRVVAMFLKANGASNLFEFMKALKDPNDRFHRKGMLLNMLRKKMNRDLYDFENQMILYPRMCEVCLETKPDMLVNCRFCPQASFCTKHIDKFRHEETCFYYTICYTSDFYLLCDESFRIIPEMKYVFFQEDNFRMPENMYMFLHEYITGVPLIWMDMAKYDYWAYICSEYFSKPLTMLYALEQLDFKIQSKLTVHIIGLAASREYEFLSMETLLHLITQLKELNVVLISPSLVERIEETNQSVNVCSKCIQKEKSFSITGYKMSYSTYVNSKSYKSPDIIICYDLGDLKCRLWNQTLLKMKRISAPLLVTNNTLSRALNYQRRMNDLFNYLTSDVHIQKNPFSSTWPYRNAADDELTLHNNFFSVYTLHNIEKIDKSKKKKKQTDQSDEKNSNSQKDENKSNGNIKEKNDNESQKSSNEPEMMEVTPSTSNLNQHGGNSTDRNSDEKGSDSEKSKKKNKKKKKKKNQSPDFLKPELANMALDASKESPSKNEKLTDDEFPSNVEKEIVDITFKLSAASMQEDTSNADAKSDQMDSNVEKKKKKKSKKKKPNQNNVETLEETQNSEAQSSFKPENQNETREAIELEIRDVKEKTRTEEVREEDLKTLQIKGEKENKTKEATEENPNKLEIEEVKEETKTEEAREENSNKLEMVGVKEETKTEEARKENSRELEINEVKKEKTEESKELTIEIKKQNKVEKAKKEIKIQTKEDINKNFQDQKPSSSSSSRDGIEITEEMKMIHFKCFEETGSRVLLGPNESVGEASGSSEGHLQINKSQYLFGDVPNRKTVAQLEEENRKLFVCVEQIAEEHRMLKINGKQTATSLLQEMECLRMSLDNIEEKVMAMFHISL